MKKLLCLILAFSAAACFFSGCTKAPTLTLSPIEPEFELRTNVQKLYAEDTTESILSYAETRHQDNQEELHITWEYSGEEDDISYLVEYGTEESFENSMWQRAKKCGTKLTNLQLGATYYVRITAQSGGENLAVSNVEQFKTVDGTIRFLNIDGVSNVRDMGAWYTESGKRVRQGLIYRGGKLEDPDDGVVVTSAGKEVLSELGIRSEIDLRGSDAAEKSQIPDASLTVISIKGGSESVTEMAYRNNGQMRHLFELLSDESSYPMYIHCAAGMDRTGYVCYVLESVLGVSREDAMRDYLLSNFAICSGKWRLPEYIEPDYVAAIEKCDGATWQEKAQNYLLSLGVTQVQIEAFKNIMLE